MQTSQSSFKKSICLLLSMAIVIASLISISSCNEKAPKGSCIALSKSKINKAWVNPGYIKDIDYLSFITCYNPINHEINVSVQAYKKLSRDKYEPIGSLVKLTTGDAWVDTLPPVAVGRNNVHLVDLDILNKGELKDFAYVNLIPFGKDGYLWYDTKVIDKNFKAITITSLTANPCPPCINCIPPCPANCTPVCTDKQLDSIQNLNVIYDSLKGR